MKQRFLPATVFPTSAGEAPQTREIKLTFFPEHPGPVPAVSWWSVPVSKQGFYLAAPCGSHVRIWRIPSGTEVFTYRGHTQTVCTAMFSPQGQQWVASSGEDRSLQIWTFAAQSSDHGSIQYRLDDVAGSLGWSSNGRIVLTAGSQQLRVFEREYSGNPPLFFSSFHRSPITRVAWSPDGFLVVSTDQEGRFAVWDVRSKAVLYWHTLPVEVLAWSPRGSHLATAGTAGEVLVWNPGSDKLQETALYERHARRVKALAWSPDQQYLVTGDETGTIDLWHAASARPMLSLPVDSPILALAWSPDGRYIAVGTQSLPLILIHVP